MSDRPRPDGVSAEAPTDLPPEGWWDVLKRTALRFWKESGTDNAAALTYYAMLALFPAFIVLVALLGLFGQASTVDTIVDILESIGSEKAAEAFREPAESVVSNRGGAGALLGAGLLGALWSASGYVGAFARANNDIWEVGEGRPFWKLKPIQILITLVAILGVAVVAVALAVSGPIATEVGSAVGLSDSAIWVWRVAKWPLMALAVVLLIALLYYTTPNVERPALRWFSPGAAVAIVAWLIASVAFAAYLANFGSYNATYGTLGGVIVLLLWLWITNCALLIGARFDAELEREREIRAGEPGARDEIQLPEREPSDDGAGHAE